MLSDENRMPLPEPPADQRDAAVAAWSDAITIPTYLPELPDRYPMYMSSRIYQGVDGRVYPLPFIDRISQSPVDHAWRAVHLQNEWVRLVLLPELGGRIHVGIDRSNGFEFFYGNSVIKPALVGLTGPWLSGGVEFNWPQHHRPATFLPMDFTIEREDDGSVTVWFSDLDPFARMKGMHGIRLRPDSSAIEVRARLYNRSDDVQTFLWWSNAAVRVHDEYQAFFPTDVHFVADHARRAITAYPAADRRYYGVDYPERIDADHPDADRIDWYRNIIVPTSYMCLGSRDDFFGGYDHAARSGMVHWADHLVSPGKKLWTWGNSEFGWGWDANLTDADGPYVELMSGIYSDNQPDFAFLLPGETKTFSEYWYPIRDTGPVHRATPEAAIRLESRDDGERTQLSIALAVTSVLPGSILSVGGPGGTLETRRLDLAPGSGHLVAIDLPGRFAETDLTVRLDHDGRELLRWSPSPRPEHVEEPEPAFEPPLPQDVATIDELYVIGRHLEQYRQGTRRPEAYWHEALRRDPGESRVTTALAASLTRQARYREALDLLRAGIARATTYNANPYDGEAHYRLGLVLERLGEPAEAYEAYGRAFWNREWAVPAGWALARLDAAAGRDLSAAERVEDVLSREPAHLQARALRIVLARRAGAEARADELVSSARELDPLDPWLCDLAGEIGSADPTAWIDVAMEYAAVGEFDAALAALERCLSLEIPPGQVRVHPLAHYHAADLLDRLGRAADARERRSHVRESGTSGCLPSRLDDIDMLLRAREADPSDPLAPALLGHWYYFVGREQDAIEAWGAANRLGGPDPVILRNLAVAAFNVQDDPDHAADLYRQAREVAPDDARLLSESDQLAHRIGTPVMSRLAVLEAEASLVVRRDDLTVELVSGLTAVGRHEEALEILSSRWFQPWEGGEGTVLAAWDEAWLARARAALAEGHAEVAREAMRAALSPTANLGEGRHPLASRAHLLLAAGDAEAAAGNRPAARDLWERAARSVGDFRGMSVVPYSDLSCYAVRALTRLGRQGEAEAVTDGLAEYAEELAVSEARTDYFTYSMPAMLLFTPDPARDRDVTVAVIRAQVAALRDDLDEAHLQLDRALGLDPSTVRALDLRRDLAGGGAGS